MDSERVNEIRAALDALDSGDENTIRMPAILAIHHNSVIWLRDLLAENARLQRLVDAGERLYEAVLEVSNPSPQFHRETQEALLPALAMYEVNTLPDIAE